MKTFISSLIILALLFSGGLLYNAFPRSSSERMIAAAEDLENAVLLNEWDEASVLCSKLSENWEKDFKKLAVIIDHTDLDCIFASLAGISAHIDYRSEEETVASIRELKLFFRNLPKKELLNIQNIF